MPRQNIEIFNLECDVAAAAMSVDPVMIVGTSSQGPSVIASFDGFFELHGMTLTSSILNFSPTARVGVFVVIGNKNTKLTFSKSIRAPMFHWALQNSYTGPPATPVPTTKTTPKSFKEPFQISPKTPIALYVFGDATAGNRCTAGLALEMVRTR